MSRALLRSALELRAPATTAASTLRPCTRLFNQTAAHIEPTAPSSSSLPPAPPSKPRRDYGKMAPPKKILPNPPRERLPTGPTTPLPTGPLDPSVRTLLPLLASQPGHYLTVHIHGRPYLVTEGDSIRLPFRMPGVEPGDVLRLNRASNVGSRDYTLKGEPWVDERLFECRALVTGTETEPMRVKEKTKRRNRRVVHKFSKHMYTMLRISEVKICEDVVEGEQA
ncbi:ribosomal protein L21-like protein [Podospora aff. communis PSN243]|uniref:Large ribosomal subunit protein bL21m n=1 Tax=Podospora aff. communis PSN243 TaxID=3040156 RepID=A0AAV9GU06_9PEZI|nr:ribosomal protein L21-like protein [Podospora aff. communis PSN243]